MPVLHDYIEQTDGGSRLCLMLAKGLQCPLFCGFVKKHHPFLQESAQEIHELCPSLYKSALAVPLLRQYIIAQCFMRQSTALASHPPFAIFSGAYAPLAVYKSSAAKNILYCHTPPRFLYDQQDLFADMAPRPLRFLLRAFCQWLRPKYEGAAQSMDVIVANSAAVQERIKHYLHLPASIVYPPCDTQKYSFETSQGFFLSMVRLDKLKRIHLLIDAFRCMPQERLVIASTGPEELHLKKLATGLDNVTFTGVLGEAKRLRLLAQCRATLCVAESEDFGMCAVESLAAGKPVIIAKAGGLQEIITHGDTGLCVSANPHLDEICTALAHMTQDAAAQMRSACHARAKDFDTKKFITKIRSLAE